MKALTVKQPWAYLICAGIKDIENRTWKCPQKYIGERVLIHASAKPTVNGGCISHWLTEKQYRFVAFNTPAGKQLDICFLEHYNSAIIGSVEIVDCVINHPSIWAEKTHYPVNPALHPIKPIYNWVLNNPVLFTKPIPVKGKLSFWDYPNIHSEPDEDGIQTCMCNIPVDEEMQVMNLIDDFRCKYCGGKWYK